MGFKIYFAIPLILGVFCMAIFSVFKKNFSTLWIFVIASVVFLIQYLPFSAGSGGLFFLPFDIPRGFFAQQGLGLTFLDQRWGIYYAHHNTFRLIEYGVLMSIGYLLAQFGVKLFGLIPLRRTIKTTGLGLYIFLYSTVLASLTLTLFFYQKVGGANIWEFLFPTSLVLAILVALNISLLLSKFNKIIMLVIVGIIIIITIPRWIYSVNLYLQVNYLSGFHGVSSMELKSYEYIKDNTPKDSNVLLIGQAYAVSFSSIGSVFTERNLFLGGTGVSQLNTPEILERKRDFEAITTSTDTRVVGAILKKDKINYVAIYKNPLSKVTTINASLQQVFSNKTSKIFKVE
jgi:hypothetical protein